MFSSSKNVKLCYIKIFILGRFISPVVHIEFIEVRYKIIFMYLKNILS